MAANIHTQSCATSRVRVHVAIVVTMACVFGGSKSNALPLSLPIATSSRQVSLPFSAFSKACSGSVTNGTRPGQDYASIKMNTSTGTSALDCQRICCADSKCATWVYVPSGLYPNRPAGTFCWLKAAPIPLKGVTCDNGKAGCVSGVVDRAPTPFAPDPNWKPMYRSNATAVPTGVSSCAVGANTDTNVYVGQRGVGVESILVLDATGKTVRGFGGGDIKNVHGMQMQSIGGKSYLWVTDSAASTVLKYDPASGELLHKIGSKGSGIHPLQFGSVADVAFDAEGGIYISDGDGGINARVIKLDQTMTVQWVIGNNGTVPCDFNFSSPHSLAYDSIGHRVVVADRNNNQVRFLDASTGKYLGNWPTSVFGAGYKDCAKPSVWSVRTDKISGQIYVATSNFGSGAACVNPPPTNLAHIVVLNTPPTTGDLDANVTATISIAHGFPHEICVDDSRTSAPDSGAVYSAAVDAADLPTGTGLGAITKYIHSK